MRRARKRSPPMDRTAEQLDATIAALQAQRALLGDAVVDTALAPLLRERAALRSAGITAEQQLKQVSVLFVDVVGSTAIGQKLDPEAIHAVMDGALERFTSIVEKLGGRVLQYAGDGMLAAFGTERVREDDVASAVMAGLQIIDAARDLAPQVRRLHGVPDFNVRAGVHTGTVLLGGGVDAEGSIRGATVNVAARMEQSAPPGRLRISHASYTLVRGLFDVEEPPPISVKGVAEPMRSYLVGRARPAASGVAQRGIDGVDAGMVGRDAEIELLRERLGEAVRTRCAHAVMVVGDAGLGKSRLLAEFERSLEPSACWLLHGGAHPRSSLEPYGVLRDLLARQLRIGRDDPAEVARTKFAAGLAPFFTQEGEAPIHRLGQLIGYDFAASVHVKDLLGQPAALRSYAFDAAALCVRRMAEMRTVVLVLDDLHWADEGSLEATERVVEANLDAPLLCLSLTRPSLFEKRPEWGTRFAHLERVDLAPLDREDSDRLAGKLLQRLVEVPAALRALITRGAEGNPFYMEELVRMLVDDGVIAVDAEDWRVDPERLLQVRVPPTLNGILQARLDALESGERAALQNAAIVGHVFWDQALAAIDPHAAERLDALLRKCLIVRRPTAAGDGVREYAFQHHLLHHVTYDGVLKAPRRQGHARVGAYWSARAEVASPREVSPASCHALAQAHYHRCLSDPRDYVGWFEGQFSHYLGAYAAQTLRPLAQQLIDVCERDFGPEDPITAVARVNLARVMVVQGDVRAAEPELQRALAIQERALALDHPDTARTYAVLGGCAQGRGDLASAASFFARAVDIRERALGADHRLTLDVIENLAKAMLELDRLDEAERLGRRALAGYERSVGADHPDAAFTLTLLGEVLGKRGEYAAAEPLIRRALTAQRATMADDHPEVGLTMWHLAETLRGLGRADEAEPLARTTLEIWETHFGAEHEWTAWALISLAEIRLTQGDANESLALSGRAAATLRRSFGDDHPVVRSTSELHARAARCGGVAGPGALENPSSIPGGADRSEQA